MMQLNPPLPVDTPKGAAYAHMVIDYSQEHYVLFVCFLCDSGECWVLPNRDVRLQQNLTMGVRVPKTAAPCACEGDQPPAGVRNGRQEFAGGTAIANRVNGEHLTDTHSHGATP